MPELEEPDLEWNERFVRDHLLTLLPNEYGDTGEIDDEERRIARSILAKEYVEHVNLDLAWKLVVILLVYDWLFYLDSQVYGLFIASLGSISIALRNVYTPDILADRTFEHSDSVRAELESQAETSVKTNVGLAGLSIGFVLQIFAVSGPIPEEIARQNHLNGDLPTWLGFVLIALLGHLILVILFDRIREYFT